MAAEGKKASELDGNHTDRPLEESNGDVPGNTSEGAAADALGAADSAEAQE